MKKLTRFLFLSLFFGSVLTSVGSAETYYLDSVNGNDGNDGLSESRAWRTLRPLNELAHAAGDRYLFKAGSEFTGGISISADGQAPAPITLSSYGQGPKPRILSGMESGLTLWNAGGLRLDNLAFIGAGADQNPSCGIVLGATGRGRSFHINQVDVSGYFFGVWLANSPGGSLDDVRITNSAVHHNADGIVLDGSSDPGEITNVFIGHCDVHHHDTRRPNAGMAAVGINFINVNGGVVERCLIHDNGVTSQAAGHAGILVQSSNRLRFQYNEVWNIFDEVYGDGQGFAVNATDVVAQYNYFHGNNIGFQFYQEFTPNRQGTVRYNIFENNVIASVFADTVHDSQFYNNTIFVNQRSGEFRVGVHFMGFQGTNVFLRNNIILTDGNAVMAMMAPSTSGFRFQNNVYYDLTRGARIHVLDGPTGYDNLAAWRAATGQETLDQRPVGQEVNPQLADPGRGGAIGNPSLLSTLNAYRLLPASPVREAGLNLRTLFNIDPGPHDFFETPLPAAGPFSMGAHQRGDQRPAPPLNARLTDATINTFTGRWNASPGATGYRIDLAREASFTDFVPGYRDRDVGNTTTQTLVGLNPDTIYHMRVRAYNQAGTSDDSAAAQGRTLVSGSPEPPPPAPATGGVSIDPNPFRPKDGDLVFRNLPDVASIVIYTREGKKVKEVKVGEDRTAEWDGTDSQGNKVPAGIYIAHARGQALKIALLR